MARTHVPHLLMTPFEKHAQHRRRRRAIGSGNCVIMKDLRPFTTGERWRAEMDAGFRIRRDDDVRIAGRRSRRCRAEASWRPRLDPHGAAVTGAEAGYVGTAPQDYVIAR